MSEFSNDPSQTSKFSAIVLGTPTEHPQLRALSADDRVAISNLPIDSALLIVLSGPNEGARFLLNSDITTAGRSTRQDIFLDDVTVSRKHAQFVRENGEFFVRDSNSLNGTYVNRELVDEAKLADGDEVRIGKFALTFYDSPLKDAHK